LPKVGPSQENWTQGRPGQYEQVASVEQLTATLEEQLVDYNFQNTTRLSLSLFEYAVQHICRISRILRQPQGHACLVGVGASGRSSLTRLAAFIAQYKLHTIDAGKVYGMNEWREDLKAVLVQAGAKCRQVAFLLSDTQLRSDVFFEDVNGLLTTGEVRGCTTCLTSCRIVATSFTIVGSQGWVPLAGSLTCPTDLMWKLRQVRAFECIQVPNLFMKDELATILEEVSPRAKRAGIQLVPTALYGFFVRECRANLHLVLAVSPVGDEFQARLRTFPALVNCCTFDWFSEWPAEGLQTVAHQLLVDVRPLLLHASFIQPYYLPLICSVHFVQLGDVWR
jgi:dynein heavy chain, axonemal